MIMAFFIRVSVVIVSIVLGGEVAADSPPRDLSARGGELAEGNPPRELVATCVLNVKVEVPLQSAQEKLGLGPSCATYSAGVSNGYVLSVVNAICSLRSDLPLTFSNWSQGISK